MFFKRHNPAPTGPTSLRLAHTAMVPTEFSRPYLRADEDSKIRICFSRTYGVSSYLPAWAGERAR